MTMHHELARFLREGLERGLPRDRLRAALLDAGWPTDQVSLALASYADVDFPVPVPRPQPYVSAREAFVYLVIFATLYGTAFSLGNLIFPLLDRAFPDPAVDPVVALEASRVAIRWAISFLVVMFPVFAVTSWRNRQSLERSPGLRLSKIRKWLTYLTLFVAAGFLVGDVTALVYNVLSGEATPRFLLKALTVAGISGSVFIYLRRDVGPEEDPR